MKIIVFLLFSFNAFSAPIFDDSSIIEIELEYDIDRLQVEKEDLREEGLEGKLTISSLNKSYPIEVLTRGNGSFACLQPQLKLKFDKDVYKKTVFKKLKKVKLFTKGTCLANKTDSDQDKGIIANYLIYKLYSEMTEYSFKTRLLKIRYHDTSGTYADYTQYGFLLEPKKHVEKRLNLENIDELDLLQMGPLITPRIEKAQLKVVNAFELMIGNYDYGIPGMFSHILNDSWGDEIYYGEKNSKIYEDQNGNLIPFIYDFDISRFGYTTSICTFSLPFFYDHYNGKFDCSQNALTDIIQKDLARFRYSDDFYLHQKGLLAGLVSWREKHRDLISLLGTAYEMGLDNFIQVMSTDLR